MAKQLARDEPAVKDYYLTLRLHPKADALMIDQAYWHLARIYSAARQTDPTAKQKLDNLNEAYSVLGSPERRDEYDRLRDAVLGEGALPTPPPPVEAPPPLRVMSKQRPTPPSDAPQRSRERRSILRPVLRRLLSSLPALSRPTLRLPKLSAPHLPTVSPPHLPERRPPAPPIDTEALRHSTEAIRARLRAAGEGPSSSHPSRAPRTTQDPSADLDATS